MLRSFKIILTSFDVNSKATFNELQNFTTQYFSIIYLSFINKIFIFKQSCEKN